MRAKLMTPFHLFYLTLLRCASLLVPQPERAEWWKEWRAELWHVRQQVASEQTIAWAAEREVASFCMGAFQDARCLRSHARVIAVPLATTKGSAKQCLLLLAGAASVSSAIALLTPAVRVELQSSPYRDAHNLVLVRDADFGAKSLPTVPAEQFQSWTRRPHRVFDEFAFYRVEQEQLFRVPGQERVGVAHASSNLFSMLGLSLRFATDADNAKNLPRLILSEELWKRSFGEDTHIAGRVISVGLQEAMIAGVAPKASWRLPGKVDAWLLLPKQSQPEGAVFAIAHVRPTASRRGERWNVYTPMQNGSLESLLCVSLAGRSREPWNNFLLAVFLACMSLPATISMPLGEYRVTAKTLSWSTRLRRWGFLLSKFLLLMPIVCFVPMALAYLTHFFVPFLPENTQVVASFLTCLFGARWILRDQRQRCPECLGILTHPARVGQPSRNFLGWNGTELICTGGHGLLHIPEHATSWFSTQRWLYLDASWKGLFVDPSLVSPG